MPDVPGSGPTDPDIILSAIHAGATLVDEHIVLARGGPRWLGAMVHSSGPRWVLTTTRGVGLDRDTYDKLVRARAVPGQLVEVDGARFALVPPEPDDAVQVAVLMPA